MPSNGKLQPAFIPYQGGKRYLWKQLQPLIPKHETYVEPFAGGATVFFNKEPAKREILNDLNETVIRLFDKAKKSPTPPVCTPPKDDAAYKAMYDVKDESWCRDYLVARCSWASRGGRAFKGAEYCPTDFSKHPVSKNWDFFHGRLKDAVLHSKDWREVAEQYDGKNAWMFMDPPYPGTGKGESYADTGVTARDVCDFAKAAKGKVLITLNDTPTNRAECAGLHIMPVNGRYRMKNGNGGNGKEASKELVVTNYEV